MATGLAPQAVALAWLAAISSPDVAYSSLIIPFVMGGTGMARRRRADRAVGARAARAPCDRGAAVQPWA